MGLVVARNFLLPLLLRLLIFLLLAVGAVGVGGTLQHLPPHFRMVEKLCSHQHPSLQLLLPEGYLVQLMQASAAARPALRAQASAEISRLLVVYKVHQSMLELGLPSRPLRLSARLLLVRYPRIFRHRHSIRWTLAPTLLAQSLHRQPQPQLQPSRLESNYLALRSQESLSCACFSCSLSLSWSFAAARLCVAWSFAGDGGSTTILQVGILPSSTTGVLAVM